MKTIVIGIDGVGYDRINRLIREGKLVNIAEIVDGGTLTKLKSTVPQVSAPAWTSFSTGMHPQNHGIYGFFKTDRNIYNGKDVHVERFWDRFDDKVIHNIPITYPPSSEVSVGGFVSPVRVKPSKEECFKMCKPEEVGNILLDHDYVLTAGEDADYQEYVDLVRKRKDVFVELLEKYPWRLGVVMFGAFDRLTHNPLTNFDSKELDDILIEIDREIGRIRGRVNDADILFLSDHGEKQVSKEFYVNQLLANNNLAHSEQDEISVESRAYCFAEEHSSWGKIKLNDEIAKKIVMDLIEKQEIVSDVVESSEVYGQDPVGDVPELLFKVKDGVPKIGQSDEIVKDKKSIQHSSYGILGANKKLNINEPEIADVGPTILKMSGLDYKGFDGSPQL